ncbi:hypothetical protein K402DRAFT_97787 [Aulographum hederae CBS 113979]|uniref:Uncharacterized protein n=1 Tax=Aulographum hederae CBS 113979 TaxID=1176131 RepID=A0A6G1GYZ4_9PEZI|nr:hypothetical protein K402DRAFT_97787 [Aulographum hederae CBS 113979]
MRLASPAKRPPPRHHSFLPTLPLPLPPPRAPTRPTAKRPPQGPARTVPSRRPTRASFLLGSLFHQPLHSVTSTTPTRPAEPPLCESGAEAGDTTAPRPQRQPKLAVGCEPPFSPCFCRGAECWAGAGAGRGLGGNDVGKAVDLGVGGMVVGGERAMMRQLSFSRRNKIAKRFQTHLQMADMAADWVNGLRAARGTAWSQLQQHWEVLRPMGVCRQDTAYVYSWDAGNRGQRTEDWCCFSRRRRMGVARREHQCGCGGMATTYGRTGIGMVKLIMVQQLEGQAVRAATVREEESRARHGQINVQIV